MTTVYLAGPILGCSDAEAIDWREEAKRELVGLDFLDPMVRDYRGREAEAFAEIVEGDKDDIDTSDVMLAMCPRPSVGTSMEVLYAWQRAMPVVVVAPPGAPVSPWLRYHASEVVETLAEACRAVRRHSL